MKYLSLLILFYSLSQNSFSQLVECGTMDYDGSMMRRLEANKRFYSQDLNTREVEWLYIPVQFHVVTQTDGTGGIDENQVLNELCHVNSNYSPHRMKFYIAADFNYIASDKLYSDPGAALSEAKIKAAKNTKALNIYIVNDISSGSSFGTILGYYTPSLDVVILRKTQFGVGSQTVSHEIGHYFSLAHPFYGWDAVPYDASVHGNPVTITSVSYAGQNIPVELMDKSNCNIAADKLCDTPPDYNFGILDDGDCKLNGPIMDHNGDTIHTMENNYMGYFFGCGNYLFTDEQVSAMRADFNSSTRSLIRTGIVPDTNIINIDDFSIISPEQDATTPYYDLVTLDWSDVANANKYLVTIYPPSAPTKVQRIFVSGTSQLTLTNLEKSKRYNWNVYPYSNGSLCAGKSQIYSFKTGSELVGIDNLDLASDKFSVYPNPTFNSQFYINSDENIENVKIKIYNILGQIVETQLVTFIEGENRINLTNSNYLKGIYNIAIETGDRLYIRRIILN